MSIYSMNALLTVFLCLKLKWRWKALGMILSEVLFHWKYFTTDLWFKDHPRRRLIHILSDPITWSPLALLLRTTLDTSLAPSLETLAFHHGPDSCHGTLAFVRHTPQKHFSSTSLRVLSHSFAQCDFLSGPGVQAETQCCLLLAGDALSKHRNSQPRRPISEHFYFPPMVLIL